MGEPAESVVRCFVCNSRLRGGDCLVCANIANVSDLADAGIDAGTEALQLVGRLVDSIATITDRLDEIDRQLTRR